MQYRSSINFQALSLHVESFYAVLLRMSMILCVYRFYAGLDSRKKERKKESNDRPTEIKSESRIRIESDSI